MNLTVIGDWLAQEVNQCTCFGGDAHYSHEPGCGYEPIAQLGEITDALKAAGHAVVKIPESDRPWGLHDGWTAGDGDYCVAGGDGHVYLSDEDAVSKVPPAYARGLAAALLAAADAADRSVARG